MGVIKINGVTYGGGDNSVMLTQAEYDALVEAGTVDPTVLYMITDRNQSGGTYASGILYDNTESGLTATNLQAAVDEIVDTDLPATNVTYDNADSGLSATTVQSAIDEIIDRIYPVGSIYLSVTDSTAAQVEARFGGTWVSFGAGKTLVGVDTNDVDFDTVEETGGEKSHSYTPAGSNAGGVVADHTLAPKELPQRAIVQARNPKSAAIATSAVNATWTSISVAANATAVTSNYDGGNNGLVVWGESTPDVGGKAHGHGFTQPTFTGTQANIPTLQPYITTYMYKRIA